MHDSTLFKIAIVSSISGILLLYIALQAGQPVPQPPSAILEGTAGSDLSVKGIITAVTQGSNATFIQVSATDSAGIVLFKPPLFNLSKGMHIEVRGRITEHNAVKEMIADEVRVI